VNEPIDAEEVPAEDALPTESLLESDGRYYEDGVYAEYFPDDQDKEREPESIVIIDDHRIRLHLHPKAGQSTLRWFSRLNSLIHELKGSPYHLNQRIENMLHSMWEGGAGYRLHINEFHPPDSPGAKKLQDLALEWLERHYDGGGADEKRAEQATFHIRHGVWQRVQSQWGYPTVIGLHDELSQWARGLADLQRRIKETLDHLPRDLEHENEIHHYDLNLNTELGRRFIEINEHYTRQLIEAVRAAELLIGNASVTALSRYST
jgi:hypothetical protein